MAEAFDDFETVDDKPKKPARMPYKKLGAAPPSTTDSAANPTTAASEQADPAKSTLDAAGA